MLAGQTDVGGTIGAAALLGAVIDTELTRSERIATPGDIDMYAFDASRGDIVRIETRLPAGGAACDTYLRIFDASGEQILVDDDRNTQSPNYSRIDGFVAPANGRYFVGVSSSANGSYRALDGTGAQDGLSMGDYTLAMTRTSQRVGETGTNDATTGEQTTKTGFDQFGPITVSIIRLTYSYAGAVTVAGTPVWQLVIGSDVVAATFTEQSGDGRTLTFEYTITNGVAGTVNPAAQLSLPTGASITDTTNAPAALTVATKPSIPDVVDDMSPRAASVSYPDAALYKRGDRLDFTVTFDEPVRVTGVPSLQLTVGAQQRTADFRFVMGGKKANKAVFSYVADVTDSDGIELEQGPIHARSQFFPVFASAAIRLGDATIKDRANNIAGLSPYREADDFPPDVRRIAIDAAAGGSVRIDADAPAAPSAPTEQGSTKLADGKLNAAEITGDTLFRVGLGTSGARVGDTVELLIGGTAFSTPQTVTLVSGDVTNGFVDFRLTGAELGADGAKSLSARVTDAAGNVGPSDPGITFTKDVVAPATPAILGIVDDVTPLTGDVPAGGWTNDTTLVITGTAETASLIEVFDGNTKLGDATVTGTAWSFTAAGLVNGRAYAFRARASDAAANISALTATRTVTVDATPPEPPPAPAEQGSTKLADGKINAAEITGDTLFRVGLGTSGARVGDTVELLIGGTAFSTPQTVTLVSGDVTNGFVDFRLTGADLGADGAKSLSARIADAAGNVGSAGEPLAFLRDTVAPSVVITSDGTTLSSGQTTLVTFDFSEPPATFGLQSVDVQGGTLSPVSAASASRYTAVFTPTSALGSVAVKESQLTDAAGNPNQRSNTVAIAYDNGGPKANAVILPRPGVYGANKRLVFSVVFNVPVKVSAGAQPALAVQVGGNSRLAIWDARAGARSFTTRLSFTLTTTPGDSAPGGIVIDSSMINGDSIRDKQGRSSIAGLPAVNATVVVDAVRPAIVGLGAVPAGPFLKGQTVQLTVTFNKPVTPVGPTAVRFTIPGFGAGTFGRPSGTGTTTLTFSYRFIKPTSGTVQIASLLTGSVRDTAGNLVRNPVIPNA